MNIYGLAKTTLLDYPGFVASTIFTGGCNFRCPFCHNMNIVENPDITQKIETDTVIEFLQKRAGVIDGVCITGGEPTLQPDLISFISEIKALGLKVKLDSNGTKTDVLNQLIEKNLVDYIAIDVKSSFNKYPEICGLNQSTIDKRETDIMISNIKNSIYLLINQQSIDYEFRTTLIKEYHDHNTIDEIGKMIKGAKHYYLQSFVDSAFVPNHALHAIPKNELQEYILQLKKYVLDVQLRGID